MLLRGIEKRPDGSKVAATEKGVSVVDIRDGVIVSVDNPSQGNWNVIVVGSGGGSLTVSGLSLLQLSDFDFVSMQGRPGHDGYFPVDTPPSAGASHPAIAFFDGDFATAKFDLRNSLGEPLQDLSLGPGSGKEDDPPKNSFFGDVAVPKSDIFLYVSGKDAKGAPYLRVLPSTILSSDNGTASSSGSLIGSRPHAISTSASSLPSSGFDSSIPSASRQSSITTTIHSLKYSLSWTVYPSSTNSSYGSHSNTTFGVGDSYTIM